MATERKRLEEIEDLLDEATDPLGWIVARLQILNANFPDPLYQRAEKEFGAYHAQVIQWTAVISDKAGSLGGPKAKEAEEWLKEGISRLMDPLGLFK